MGKYSCPCRLVGAHGQVLLPVPARGGARARVCPCHPMPIPATIPAVMRKPAPLLALLCILSAVAAGWRIHSLLYRPVTLAELGAFTFDQHNGQTEDIP